MKTYSSVLWQMLLMQSCPCIILGLECYIFHHLVAEFDIINILAHDTFLATWVMPIYLASASDVDFDTLCCLELPNVIAVPLIICTIPVIDFLSSRSVAKSESEYLLIVSFLLHTLD